ncbi:MAG: phosphate acyltransferase PlsX [Bacteroidetes bacterium]|nr:phosphate acyltransferase PlsX [Bacteroidota bacterium]MBS1973034.1 phosphate acyltransferase PlsX [Bacteroidota bacterium]
MNIGLDMMGGDYTPREAVKGVQLYLSENPSAALLFLFGDETQLNELLNEYSISSPHVKVVHAPQVIGMHEHPTKALKEKQQSSIAVGFHLLASGKTDAFISAGNTGAMMVGALFSIKTIEGVQRPTIATIIPKENGKTGMLLDVGLNADCKPENLNQFATLGSLYAQNILGINNPRVGLLNIGEEEGKGNILAQAAYPLLRENKAISFIGNIEGRDVFLDKADVMVCEGFTGNVILKLAESVYDITKQKGIHHEYFDRFNFENYGGTPVLGVAKPVIIGHGISQAKAFKNMILVAQKMIETSLLGKMKSAFKV